MGLLNACVSVWLWTRIFGFKPARGLRMEFIFPLGWLALCTSIHNAAHFCCTFLEYLVASRVAWSMNRTPSIQYFEDRLWCSSCYNCQSSIRCFFICLSLSTPSTRRLCTLSSLLRSPLSFLVMLLLSCLDGGLCHTKHFCHHLRDRYHGHAGVLWHCSWLHPPYL